MKKWLKRIIVWGLTLIVLGFLAWKFFGPKTPEPPESYTVSIEDVQSTVSINATLVPQIYANVSAETLTEVTEVHANVGDVVQAGDLLVTLDRASLWKQIEVAKLDVDRAVLAEQQGREDSSNLPRRNRLSLKKASEQARLRLQELYTLSAKGVLTSPISGVVTTMNARAGEVVTGTTSPVAGVTAGTVIRVIDPSSLAVEAFVSESDIVTMRVGQKATMSFDALPDEDFSAVITHIDPEASSIQDVIYFKTEFTIDRLDDRLRSGMSGDINVISQEKIGVPTIPLRFVSRDDSGQFVWTANGFDAKGSPLYAKSPIQTGVQSDDGLVEITDGISDGVSIYNVVEEKEEN
jgi:RND family efflux transporter MFP subunit